MIKEKRDRKVVSTIAVPLSGNRGSSSMLMSIVENLSRADDDILFNVYSYYPKVDRKKNKWSNVRIMSGTPLNILLHIVPLSFVYYVLSLLKIRLPLKIMSEDVRALAESDLYIAAGGTTFNDAKLLKVVFNVLCLLPAIFLRLKLVLYTQTLGPFNNPINRLAAKIMLPKAKVVIARGQNSYDNLSKLGLGNIDWATDAAFALPNANRCVDIVNNYRKSFEGKITVGISPNSIVEAACREKGIGHAEIFAEFIDSLIERDYLPVLIPHSAKVNSRNRHNNDIPVIDDILRHVRRPECLIYIKEDYDYLELRNIIGLLDYYIASRFHSMISALYMNVPTVVYGWGYHKYQEVIKEFGFDERVVFDYSDLSVDGIKNSFASIVRNKDSIKNKISDALPSVIEKSNRANKILIRELSK